jgi:hypothetical protein
MPLFIIETTAESPIREFWQVEAANAREARDKFDNGEVGAFLWDEVTGDEIEREVSLVHGPGDLDSTVAIHRAQQAAPVMLAALRLAADALSPARNAEEADALLSIQSAIAAATGEPTGNQSPVAVAQPDESWPGDLATYRITETVSYLVKAEDEAHAERRFVCEVGIHAACFHAVEGRTIDLVEEGEE